MTDPMKFTFTKPEAILRKPRFLNGDIPSESDYIKLRKSEIENELNKLHISIREAELSDIGNILDLAERAYAEMGSKGLVSSYDYFQSITYSFGIVLEKEASSNDLIGCFFNFAFHTIGDKVCNLKRLAIEPDYQRYGLGKYLFEYNQLLVRERYGSRIQTGLVEYYNFPSLALVVNKMGGVIDFLTDDMTDYFLCYSFVVPLDLSNWNQMEVSQSATSDYLKTLEEGEDYIIFRFDDQQKMKEVCADKNFKVAAALYPNEERDYAALVAFSSTLLNLKLKE
jgi:GNAT superfamily N-acetyltransferase